jgi:hypothetical protein
VSASPGSESYDAENIENGMWGRPKLGAP